MRFEPRQGGAYISLYLAPVIANLNTVEQK